jgi:type IV secretion system protein VirB1
MPLDAQTLLTLAAACAPHVAPQTLLAVVRAESGLDPLAIGVNGPDAPAVRVRSRDEAMRTASRLIAAGRDIDLGLGQINLRNLAWLGLSVEDAFDPCRNLEASGRVLALAYQRGVAAAGPGQSALRIAFSLYNTGHAARGFANGYVARVTGATRPAATAATALPPPIWDSFAIARRAWAREAFVLTLTGAAP